MVKAKPMLSIVGSAEETPMPLNHNSADRLPFDDDDVRYIVQQLEQIEAREEIAVAALKAVRKEKSKITNFGQDKGIPAEYLKIGRHLAQLDDQVDARQKPAILIKICKALGMEFKESSNQGDMFTAFFADPYEGANGTSNPAGEEMKYYERGKREANALSTVRGKAPEGISQELAQAYLRGQAETLKANEDAFLRKHQIPVVSDDTGDDDDGSEGADDSSDRDPDDDEDDAEGDGSGGSIDAEDERRPIDWVPGPNDHIAHAALDRLAAEGGED